MKLRLGLFIFSFLLFATGVKAEYFIIKNFQLAVNFTEDGYANFDETIEVEFSEPRHGIFQFIPMRGEIHGRGVTWIFKDIEVEGYKFSTFKENDNIVIKIGDPDRMVDGRQIYHISFKVLNTLNFFKDNIEFYWDLLGVSWTTDIENFSFDLKFPDKVNLSTEDVLVYTGAAGSKEHDVDLLVFPTEVKGKTTRVFTPGEGVTIVVNFPADTFQP